MKELAKWLWIIFLGVLFGGYVFLIFVPVCLLIYVLIKWLRPEWLENDKESKKRTKELRLEKAVCKRYRKLALEGNYPENCLTIENVRDGKKTVCMYWIVIEGLSLDKSYYENKVIRVDMKLTTEMNCLMLQIASKSDDVKAIRWGGCRLNGHRLNVDEFGEDEQERDEVLTSNKAVLRTLKAIDQESKNVTPRLIKGAMGYSGRVMNLKLRLIYRDNIAEIISIGLRVKEIKETYSYRDSKPKNYIGKEILPKMNAGEWKSYVTKNDVQFCKGQAYVILSVTKGLAFLNGVKEVPQGTPVLLKGGSKGHAMIVENPSQYNYSNRLMVSDGIVGDDVFVLANKSKGVGFYKWDGGNLDVGEVFISTKTVKDDFIGLTFS